MKASAVILPDELLFARIACSKIANILLGTISVGLAALKGPYPREFLQKQEKLILALIAILHSTPVKSEGLEMSQSLREETERLSHAVKEFFAIFFQLTQWKNFASEEIREAIDQLASSHEEVLHALQDLSDRLEMEQDFQQQMKEGQEILESYNTILSGM